MLMPLPKAYMLYLAHWARKLPWKETALSFGTTWDQVGLAVDSLESARLGVCAAAYRPPGAGRVCSPQVESGFPHLVRYIMNFRKTLTTVAMAVAVLITAGCAVSRDQQTTGAYIDDAAITTQVRSRMLDSPNVAGTSISVETLNGTVMLSGFAKTTTERDTAERIARDVNGVKSVKNQVIVRP